MKIREFPSGVKIDEWFEDDTIPTLKELGKKYNITYYGVENDGNVYTKEIQFAIDEAASKGGGVIYVPKGVYLTGALYFKKGVHLYIEEDGVLKGSDDINDYVLEETRIEGQTCLYYSAMINADSCDGFTIAGKGIIDGNGDKSWKAFWNRRKWNPSCTNKDEQRARLIYIQNSSNVTFANVTIQNAQFWTTHLYKCDHVRYINCNIFSPLPAPSTDAIDIDVCDDILIKNCYISVNDDGVVLKGGKGPWADQDPNNGKNERILIDSCYFGFCHSCFTCGSESIEDRDVVIRNCELNGPLAFFKLKMRPDTPQVYEYIHVSNIKGEVESFLDIHPWTQFFDLQDREDIPLSYARYITFDTIDVICDIFFDVAKDESQYVLSDFTFEDLRIEGKDTSLPKHMIKNMLVGAVEAKQR